MLTHFLLRLWNMWATKTGSLFPPRQKLNSVSKQEVAIAEVQLGQQISKSSKLQHLHPAVVVSAPQCHEVRSVPLSQSLPLHPGGHRHSPETWWHDAPCTHWHLSSHPAPNNPASHAEQKRCKIEVIINKKTEFRQVSLRLDIQHTFTLWLTDV